MVTMRLEKRDPESRNPHTNDLGGKKISDLPEVNLIIFSFLLHFVWEFLQVPTYQNMMDISHWEGIKLCTAATFGDVGFALTAYWLASWFVGDRYWFKAPTLLSLSAYLCTGLALTVGFEYYYTNISFRWSYSELMPLVPPFGTGLSPMLQWMIIPLLVIWFMDRQRI